MQYRYRFSIKKPTGARRTFDIVCDKRNAESRSQSSIKKIPQFESETKTLAELNERFIANKIDERTTKVMVEQIVKGLKTKVNTIKDAQSNVVISDENMRLFNEYWNDVYADRRLKDRQRAYNTFMYALRTLEPLSLIGSDKESIRRHFEKKLSGNAHRRYTVYLNMLMKYHKRDFTLSTERAEIAPIDYIEIDDFKRVLSTVSDDKLRLLMATLFCTGARTGEPFAFTKQSIRGDLAVFITHQIDRKLVRRGTKNGREHEAVIIRDFLPELKAWCALSPAEKNEIRLTCGHSIAGALRAQGYDLSAHDLRHSYVHFLSGKSLSLEDIAACIGDTIEVTEKHYKGWILGDKRVAHLAKLVNS